MKKTALFFIILLLGSFGWTAKARAQAPGVLAALTTRRPAPLPKIVYGQDISFREMAEQDLVAAGGTVNIAGVVKNNLVVAGGQVTLSGEVMGNVIVVGGAVKTGASSHIGGYLLAVGGKVETDGKIDGSTRIYSGDVTTSGKSLFGGDLTVDAGKIAVANGAKIMGMKKLTEINSNGNMPWGYWNQVMPATPQKRTFAGMITFFKLVELAGKIVFMLVLIKVFGSHLATIYKDVKARFWPLLGWGALKLFITPILIIFLLMTVIGIPIAILFGVMFFGSIFLSGYISSAILGHWFFVKGWLKNNNLYVQGIIGLVALEIIGFVPIFGWLVKFGALLLGLGLIVKWERSLLGMKG